MSHGYQRIRIAANDTDVIVLRISFFIDTDADKLWVDLESDCGTFQLMTSAVGLLTISPTKAKALPAFHALTESENTSFFSATGKKSARGQRPEFKSTPFCHLMDKPETPSSDDIAVIKSFVISLYPVFLL